MSGTCSQNGLAILAQACGPSVLQNLEKAPIAFYASLFGVMSSSSMPAADAAAAAAAAEPVAIQHVDVEMSGSESEWIQIKDDAIMVHDKAIREEQETTPFLLEAQVVESDDKPLAEKLQEMEGALAKLSVGKEGKDKKQLAFDDDAEIIEISPRKPVKKDAAAASTTGAFGPEEEVGASASSAMETDAIDPNAPIQF